MIKRILHNIGRLATGISGAITIGGLLLSFVGVISPADFGQIYSLTVPLAVIWFIMYLLTGEE